MRHFASYIANEIRTNRPGGFTLAVLCDYLEERGELHRLDWWFGRWTQEITNRFRSFVSYLNYWLGTSTLHDNDQFVETVEFTHPIPVVFTKIDRLRFSTLTTAWEIDGPQTRWKQQDPKETDSFEDAICRTAEVEKYQFLWLDRRPVPDAISRAAYSAFADLFPRWDSSTLHLPNPDPGVSYKWKHPPSVRETLSWLEEHRRGPTLF